MATRRKHRAPLSERIVGGISAVIVLATLGYLSYETFRPEPDEPSLSVAIEKTRQTGDSYVVDVAVRNSGRGAAADVHLIGRVGAGTDFSATGEARVDYVPGFSSGHASLVFGVDPAGQLTVRITGYARP